LEINVDAFPVPGNGYTLVASVKATANVTVRLAISTAENATLAKALRSEGIKTDVIPFKKLVRVEKDSNFGGLADRSFVPIPMRADGSRIKIFVPGAFKEVEEAPLLLLVGADPVVAGRISLFK